LKPAADLAWIESLLPEDIPPILLALAARLLKAGDKPASASASTNTLLTAPEMAALLGVKASWLRSKARKNELPVIVLGRYRRFDPVAVRAAALALEGKP